jgi:hypothetical protein
MRSYLTSLMIHKRLFVFSDANQYFYGDVHHRAPAGNNGTRLDYKAGLDLNQYMWDRPMQLPITVRHQAAHVYYGHVGTTDPDLRNQQEQEGQTLAMSCSM